MKSTDNGGGGAGGGDLNGSYINDALKCSALDISGGKDCAAGSAASVEPIGASKGSNEYICKCSNICTQKTLSTSTL